MPKASPLVYLFRTPTKPDPYEAALTEAGFRCRSVPVLGFAFVGQEALRAALAHPDRYAGLVLTSPRAAEALAEGLSWLPSRTSAWVPKPAFAVGPRTSEALRGLGFRPRGEEAGGAEALADVLGQNVAELDGPLLFLCGDRRRETLPERLSRMGIAFEERVVYRTLIRTSPDLPGEAPDWIVFFSPSGVEAVSRTSTYLGRPSVRAAAIGPATAEALRRAGRVADVVARAPTPEALAEALGHALRGQRGRPG